MDVQALLGRRLPGGGVPSLHTDRRDPIANRVYERIGFRPVLDVSHYRFATG